MSELTNLQKQLFELQDLKYRDFHAHLIPDIDKEKVIGIRTPQLRKFAKEYAKTEVAEKFLTELPHTYYEENNLHMMIISGRKDYEECVKEVEDFLPYVDNFPLLFESFFYVPTKIIFLPQYMELYPPTVLPEQLPYTMQSSCSHNTLRIPLPPQVPDTSVKNLHPDKDASASLFHNGLYKCVLN